MARQTSKSPTRKVKAQALATALVAALAAAGAAFGWWDPAAAEVETWTALAAAVLALPPVASYFTPPNSRDAVATSRAEKLRQ